MNARADRGTQRVQRGELVYAAGLSQTLLREGSGAMAQWSTARNDEEPTAKLMRDQQKLGPSRWMMQQVPTKELFVAIKYFYSFGSAPDSTRPPEQNKQSSSTQVCS